MKPKPMSDSLFFVSTRFTKTIVRNIFSKASEDMEGKLEKEDTNEIGTAMTPSGETENESSRKGNRTVGMKLIKRHMKAREFFRDQGDSDDTLVEYVEKMSHAINTSTEKRQDSTNSKIEKLVVHTAQIEGKKKFEMLFCQTMKSRNF